MGFRDIQLFNVALLAKIAWRIITKPECLLAKILLGKYCHKTPFLKTAPTNSSSHGWKGILQGRDLLMNHLGKAIGDGEDTNIWTDSWINSVDKRNQGVEQSSSRKAIPRIITPHLLHPAQSTRLQRCLQEKTFKGGEY